MTIPFRERVISLTFLVTVLLLWEAAVRVLKISPLLVPAPSAIGVRAAELVWSGQIWPHLAATLTSVLVGLAAGTLSGLLFGGLIALLRLRLSGWFTPTWLRCKPFPKLRSRLFF